MDPGPSAIEREEARAARLVDELWKLHVQSGSRAMLVRDHASVLFRCSACDTVRAYTIQFSHSPYNGEVGSPEYRDLDEAFALLEGLCARRHPLVSPEEEERARRCDCGAPPHTASAIGAALVHSMIGTGAHLLLGIYDGVRSAVRCPIDGVPDAIDADEVASAFGAPLALFDTWRRVRSATEAPVVRAEAEPGVWCWRAPRAAPMEDEVAAATRGPVVVLELADDIVTSDAWPPDLRGALIDERLALVVERARLRRAMEALVWSRTELSVEDDGGDRIVLRGQGLELAAAPSSVMAKMGSYGRTLGEACALVLEPAIAQAERALALFRAAGSMRPALRWELEAGILTPISSEGRGRSTNAMELARVELSAADLAREIAFLADEPPSWADITRVCPCGAPASVQRRLVALSLVHQFARQHAGASLLVLGTSDEPPIAQVVAIACDRHARFCSEAELHKHGLSGEALGSRLAADAPHAALALEAQVLRDAAGRGAAIAWGPFAASALLEPMWCARLAASLGLPAAPLEAIVQSADAFMLFDPEIEALERDRAARRLAELAQSAGRWALRLQVDASGPAGGRLTVRERP